MGHLHAVPSVTVKRTDDNRAGTALRPMLHPAVLQAIASMRARYFDSITLTELAAEVFVSPFHFSRIFAQATGVTPGRYLTAIRLFEAKRLLLTTTLTVSDVVCSVGYSSVGTFTSRFTRAVGMTPTEYRDPEVAQFLVALAPHFRHLPPLPQLREAGHACASASLGNGTIHARIEMPTGAPPADMLVGVFGDAVPQRGPVAFTGRMNSGTGDVEIHGVPEGEWWVIAIAEHFPGTANSTFSLGSTRQNVSVRADRAGHVRLHMRLPGPIDPPFAITLAPRPTSANTRLRAQGGPHLRSVA